MYARFGNIPPKKGHGKSEGGERVPTQKQTLAVISAMPQTPEPVCFFCDTQRARSPCPADVLWLYPYSTPLRQYRGNTKHPKIVSPNTPYSAPLCPPPVTNASAFWSPASLPLLSRFARLTPFGAGFDSAIIRSRYFSASPHFRCPIPNPPPLRKIKKHQCGVFFNISFFL